LGPWTCSQILTPWSELVDDHSAPCTKSFSLVRIHIGRNITRKENNVPGEPNVPSKSLCSS
jgi:hypothetical protein